jgi:hypothetical protein
MIIEDCTIANFTIPATGGVPKILLMPRPQSSELFFFIAVVSKLMPKIFFNPCTFGIKDIIVHANSQGLTHVAILSEECKNCTELLFSHLTQGPTTFFKVSSIRSFNGPEKYFKPGCWLPCHTISTLLTSVINISLPTPSVTKFLEGHFV